jgi:hypothetical protein
MVYQNIVRNIRYGISVNSLSNDQTGHPINDLIANNTFVNNDNPIIFEGGVSYGSNVRFWNNIVYDSNTYAIAAEEATGPGDFSAEHNVYFTFANFAYFRSNMNFATWKSNFGQDSAAPASVNADPQFVNAGGGNFHLQAGSPAANIGRAIGGVGGGNGTTIPAGAYITGNEVIGPTTGSSDPPPPPPPPVAPPGAPSGLRITN